MKKYVHARDPFDDLVIVGNYYVDSLGFNKEFPYSKIAIVKVIEHPAVMIEVFDKPPPKRYYYRAINWEHTLLVGVHKEDGVWVVRECMGNPSGKFMLNIFHRGLQQYYKNL